MKNSVESQYLDLGSEMVEKKNGFKRLMLPSRY